MTAQSKKPERKQAPKNRLLSKARRRKLIEAALDGKNLKDVAISTGLSPKTAASQASQILNEPKCQQAFNDILEAAGVSDKFLAQKIKNLSDAKETKFFTDKGIVTDSREVEALSIQADMVKFATKVKGHVQDRQQAPGTGETYIDLTQYNITINQKR